VPLGIYIVTRFNYCTHNEADLLIFFFDLLSRLGLSSIVDLSFEFPNGMHTWFEEEWSILKQKVQSRINMLPMKFEGRVLESIVKIEGVY
jgi:hypothetical protein